MNLELARNFGRARFRVLDFEVSGCARSLRRALRRAGTYVPRGQVAPLEEAYRECETALLYWTGPYVLAQDEFAPWNIANLGSQLFVYDWAHARAVASPLDDVLHYLTVERARSERPLSPRELRAAMRRAREFALEAYPAWRWPMRVVGALTLAYLLGALLRRCAANRSMDDDDPLTQTYRKLIENRSAWMPG